MTRSGRTYRVTNATRGAVLATCSGKVDTFLRRGVGLMGKKSLPDGGGLIIEPCNGVVSFFMRFPIDVLFIGSDGGVRHALSNFTPWRVSKVVRGSRFVVELPAGSIARSGTQVGDSITVEPA